MVRNFFKNRLNKEYKEGFNENNDYDVETRMPLLQKVSETKNYKGEIKNTIKVILL
jgi:hypothetical protein